jgi:hypothetical protein
VLSLPKYTRSVSIKLVLMFVFDSCDMQRNMYSPFRISAFAIKVHLNYSFLATNTAAYI